jgi:hypothetical protein
VLTDGNSGIQLDGETFVLEDSFDLADQLQPPVKNGLLVALHTWRTMLINGPHGFGEVIYFGSIPDAVTNAQVDILTARREGLESHFLFDRNDQRLLGIELFSGVDQDPCIIRFANYQNDGKLLVPSEITVTQGDQQPSLLQVNQFEFLEIEK